MVVEDINTVSLILRMPFLRVSELQGRVSSLKNLLYSQIVHPLLSRSSDDTGNISSASSSRSLGRSPRAPSSSGMETVSEARLMDTSPAFRHVHSCLQWVDNKQVSDLCSGTRNKNMII